MKPFDLTVGQSYTNLMRVNPLAREGTRDGGLTRRELPALAVMELIVAIPLRHRKVLSRSEHVKGGPISEDEFSLPVNDGKRHTYVVENGLEQRLGLEPQEGHHGLRSCLAMSKMICHVSEAMLHKYDAAGQITVAWTAWARFLAS